MSRTLADHARAYRRRKAAKLERYETALRLIAQYDFNEAGIVARVALQGIPSQNTTTGTLPASDQGWSQGFRTGGGVGLEVDGTDGGGL